MQIGPFCKLKVALRDLRQRKERTPSPAPAAAADAPAVAAERARAGARTGSGEEEARGDRGRAAAGEEGSEAGLPEAEVVNCRPCCNFFLM